MSEDHLNNIPTVLVIFGVTGDLSTAKLLPALCHLNQKGMLPEIFHTIGIARGKYTDTEFRTFVKIELDNIKGMDIDDYSWKDFAESMDYLQGDLSNQKTFEELAQKLNDIDNKYGICTHKIFYLAIYPELIGQVVDGIQHTQLFQICKNTKDTRVVVEKPFGENLSDFHKLNKNINKAFAEPQIYRIDHFLGKETVQNLIYLRAANPAIFNSWNRSNIDMVEINVFESIGIEDRGRYFDKYGQLRDMVQSHVLQLLATTLMDLPAEISPEKVAAAKTNLIKRLKIENIKTDAVRAQYKAGVVAGRQVKAYTKEEYVDRSSQTETFVRINAVIKGGTWDGLKVKFTTGKRLSDKNTRIAIHFKNAEVVKGLEGSNKLFLNIQPHEGIVLEMRVKKPGSTRQEVVNMSFDYKESFTTILPDAYEKILLDIIRLNRGISITAEELEASWEFVDAIRDYWSKHKTKLLYYPAGSNELVE